MVGFGDLLGVVFGLEIEETPIEQLMVHRSKMKKALVELMCVVFGVRLKERRRWQP